MKTRLFLIKGIVLFILIIFSVDRIGMLMATEEREINIDRTGDCDVAFVGSSHIYRSVNPQLLYDQKGLTSVNLSTSSQTIQGSYWLIKGYLKRYRPQVIFMDLYPTANSAKDAAVLWTMHEYDPLKYVGYYDLKNDEFDLNDANRFLAFRTGYNSIDKADFDYLKGKGQYKASHWYMAVYSETVPITEEEVQEIHNASIEIDTDKQIRYIEKTIEETKKKGVRLVLLASPYSTNQSEEAFYDVVNGVAEKHGVEFLNFTSDDSPIRFDLNSDYSDAFHLSYQGGTKYTEYLGDYIQNDLGINHDPGRAVENIWEENKGNYQSIYDITHLQDDVTLTEKLDIVDKLPDAFAWIITFDKDSYLACDHEEREALARLGITPDFEDNNYYAAFSCGQDLITVMGEESAELYENIDGTSYHIYRGGGGGSVNVGGHPAGIANTGVSVTVYCMSYSNSLIMNR